MCVSWKLIQNWHIESAGLNEYEQIKKIFQLLDYYYILMQTQVSVGE